MSTEVNMNGLVLLDFCDNHDCKIANTFFKSSDSDTWIPAGKEEAKQTLDHVIVHEDNWEQVISE